MSDVRQETNWGGDGQEKQQLGQEKQRHQQQQQRRQHRQQGSLHEQQEAAPQPPRRIIRNQLSQAPKRATRASTGAPIALTAKGSLYKANKDTGASSDEEDTGGRGVGVGGGGNGGEAYERRRGRVAPSPLPRPAAGGVYHHDSHSSRSTLPPPGRTPSSSSQSPVAASSKVGAFARRSVSSSSSSSSSIQLSFGSRSPTKMRAAAAGAAGTAGGGKVGPAIRAPVSRSAANAGTAAGRRIGGGGGGGNGGDGGSGGVGRGGRGVRNLSPAEIRIAEQAAAAAAERQQHQHQQRHYQQQHQQQQSQHQHQHQHQHQRRRRLRRDGGQDEEDDEEEVVSEPPIAPRRRRGRKGRSIYRGVCVTREGKWRAVIYKERKQLYLGVYESELEAAKAHDRAARFHFPDKSMTNFATEADADRLIAEQKDGGGNSDGGGECRSCRSVVGPTRRPTSCRDLAPFPNCTPLQRLQFHANLSRGLEPFHRTPSPPYDGEHLDGGSLECRSCREIPGPLPRPICRDLPPYPNLSPEERLKIHLNLSRGLRTFSGGAPDTTGLTRFREPLPDDGGGGGSGSGSFAQSGVPSDWAAGGEVDTPPPRPSPSSSRSSRPTGGARAIQGGVPANGRRGPAAIRSRRGGGGGGGGGPVARGSVRMAAENAYGSWHGNNTSTASTASAAASDRDFAGGSGAGGGTSEANGNEADQELAKLAAARRRAMLEREIVSWGRDLPPVALERLADGGSGGGRGGGNGPSGGAGADDGAARGSRWPESTYSSVGQNGGGKEGDGADVHGRPHQQHHPHVPVLLPAAAHSSTAGGRQSDGSRGFGQRWDELQAGGGAGDGGNNGGYGDARTFNDFGGSGSSSSGSGGAESGEWPPPESVRHDWARRGGGRGGEGRRPRPHDDNARFGSQDGGRGDAMQPNAGSFQDGFQMPSVAAGFALKQQGRGGGSGGGGRRSEGGGGKSLRPSEQGGLGSSDSVAAAAADFALARQPHGSSTTAVQHWGRRNGVTGNGSGAAGVDGNMLLDLSQREEPRSSATTHAGGDWMREVTTSFPAVAALTAAAAAASAQESRALGVAASGGESGGGLLEGIGFKRKGEEAAGGSYGEVGIGPGPGTGVGIPAAQRRRSSPKGIEVALGSASQPQQQQPPKGQQPHGLNHEQNTNGVPSSNTTSNVAPAWTPAKTAGPSGPASAPAPVRAFDGLHGVGGGGDGVLAQNPTSAPLLAGNTPVAAARRVPPVACQPSQGKGGAKPDTAAAAAAAAPGSRSHAASSASPSSSPVFATSDGAAKPCVGGNGSSPSSRRFGGAASPLSSSSYASLPAAVAAAAATVAGDQALKEDEAAATIANLGKEFSSPQQTAGINAGEKAAEEDGRAGGEGVR